MSAVVTTNPVMTSRRVAREPRVAKLDRLERDGTGVILFFLATKAA